MMAVSSNAIMLGRPVSLLPCRLGFSPCAGSHLISTYRLLHTDDKGVDLRFQHYEPAASSRPSSSNKTPLIIMHGLLGSKSNWHSLSGAICRRTCRPVFNVDARNHGASPHTPLMTYQLMARDVTRLVRRQCLDRVCLLGHSMGGRVMMALALSQPHLVERLVVVDMSPCQSASSGISSSVGRIVRCLVSQPLPQVTSQRRARQLLDRLLERDIPEKLLRQFLLTNVVEKADGSGVRWRMNLAAISDNLPHMADFDATSFTADAPACSPVASLFVAGQNSDYIRREDQEDIKRIFPASHFVYIPDAGHWVHSDQPDKFTDAVCPFLS